MARPALGATSATQKKSARKACLTGDFAKGVSILADLFVEDEDPVHVYNQGRCYEQNRRYEEALAKFDEFLRIAEGRATQEEKAVAEKHIAECKERLLKERIDSSAQPLPSPSPVAAPLPRPIASHVPKPLQPEIAVAHPAAPLPTGERRWGLVTAGIVTGVVGAGGVLAGVVFNIKANNAAERVETKMGAYPVGSKDEKDFRTYAWIGYGTGAACLVSGAVLIGLGAVRSSPSPPREIALIPTLEPGQMGAVLTGGFW